MAARRWSASRVMTIEENATPDIAFARKMRVIGIAAAVAVAGFAFYLYSESRSRQRALNEALDQSRGTPVPVAQPERPVEASAAQLETIKGAVLELSAMGEKCAAPRPKGVEEACMGLLRNSRKQSAEIRERFEPIPRDAKGLYDTMLAADYVDSCCACGADTETWCKRFDERIKAAKSALSL